MTEQRYQAVLAVIIDGLSISQVASKVGVSRQTLHSWLARYEGAAMTGPAARDRRSRKWNDGNAPHRWSCGRWMWWAEDIQIERLLDGRGHGLSDNYPEI